MGALRGWEDLRGTLDEQLVERVDVMGLGHSCFHKLPKSSHTRVSRIPTCLHHFPMVPSPWWRFGLVKGMKDGDWDAGKDLEVLPPQAPGCNA